MSGGRVGAGLGKGVPQGPLCLALEKFRVALLMHDRQKPESLLILLVIDVKRERL